jgi:hypothetical protein
VKTVFQIIIIAIAIAVTVAICIASIWFGGTTWTESGMKATFNKYLQQGSQIKAAFTLMKGTTGAGPSGPSDAQMQSLVSQNYLSSVPGADVAGNWFIADNTIFHPLTDTAECARMNRFAQMDVSDPGSNNGCPSCSDAAYTSWPACQSDAPIPPQAN